MTTTVITMMSDVMKYCKVNGIKNDHLETHFEDAFVLSMAVLNRIVPEDVALSAMQPVFDQCVAPEFLGEMGLWSPSDDVIANRNNDLFNYIINNNIDIQEYTMLLSITDVTIEPEERNEETLFDRTSEWLLEKMGVDNLQVPR